MPRFVDTNVLVYAEDRDAGRKHERARDLILDLWEQGDGVVSVQVLQEFFVTVTRKVRRPLPLQRARRIVDEYLTWRVVNNTGLLLLDAIDLARSARLSFWDALVVAAARSAGCEALFSEDFNAGQRFGAVRVLNPFA